MSALSLYSVNMILVIAILYTTYMAILKALSVYRVSGKHLKYGYLLYKLIAVCKHTFQY